MLTLCKCRHLSFNSVSVTLCFKQFLSVLPLSEKLRIRQANRRNEPQISHAAKKNPVPFFSGQSKNALIITGGWLVGSI